MMFPTAVVVHVVRQAEDVVLANVLASTPRTSHKAAGPRGVARHWAAYDAMMRAWAELPGLGLAAGAPPAPAGAFVEVSFESLTAAPEATLRDALLPALGLSWHAALGDAISRGVDASGLRPLAPARAEPSRAARYARAGALRGVVDALAAARAEEMLAPPPAEATA